MRKIDKDAFTMLGEMTAGDDRPPPPKGKVRGSVSFDDDFEPSLNDGAQRQLYRSKKRNILAWSEKGAGKTFGAIHKMVKHCVKHPDALGLIVVKVRSMANKGGAWDKLRKQVLPEWKAKRGVWFSEVKFDSQKNETIYIQNRHGGLSQIVLISALHAKQLRDRAPGYEPSFALVDELDKTDSDEYYKAIAAQIGRRPGIPGEEQQYIGCCNPAGPSHWVYKLWFLPPFDEETNQWLEMDEDFEAIYFPAESNKKNMPKGYFEHLRKVYRSDPIALARLLGGQWIDRPSGESIFGTTYSVDQHVRPLLELGKPNPFLRIRPNSKYPVIMGIDSGSSHHSFSFLQWLPLEHRMKWSAFDEVVIIKKQLSYKKIMPILQRRLRFWFELVGPMPLIAISDDSAFKQFRPGQGSFDYMDMEKAWNLMAAEMGLPPLAIKMAPKFPDSVRARIRTVQNVLTDEELVVSSACKKHQSMFLLLEKEKPKKGAEDEFDSQSTKIRRSPHIHVFDSMSYPMLTAVIEPHKLLAARSEQMLIKVA